MYGRSMNGNLDDITAMEPVEVQIRADGKVLWVHVGGITILRICQITELNVDDSRPRSERRVAHD